MKPPTQTPIPSSIRSVPLDSYSKTKISASGKEMTAYVADTEDKAREGLMFVKPEELGEDEGMLFVFPSASFKSFWMKNTLIPLDIAYLDSRGTVINILTMKPLDESSYPSDAPAKYALEAHAGWFARNGIVPGDKITFSLTPK
jgi:uncharacterized membrane protein (UPF0127 family)